MSSASRRVAGGGQSGGLSRPPGSVAGMRPAVPGRGREAAVAHVSAAQAWTEKLLSVLGSAAPVGRSGKWQCPVHARAGEHAPSLAIGTRDEGGAWVFCHAGCSACEVCAALGMTLDHLSRPPRLSPQAWIRVRRLRVGFPAPKATGSPRTRGFRYETTHHYGPDFRLERWRHPVSGEKAMEWWARNHQGEFVPGLLGTPERDLPLYREGDLVMALGAGETVLVVESESSVDALNRAGWYATTWAGGAGAPPVDWIAEILGGHDRVVIIGDADDAGRTCVARLSEALPRAVVVFSDRGGEDARDLHTRLGEQGFARRVAAALTAAS